MFFNKGAGTFPVFALEYFPSPTHTPKGATTQLACKTDWTVTVSQQTSGGIRQEAPSIPERGQTWMTDPFYRWRRQWPE